MIYATIVFLANEMHRVKDLLLADNPKQHHRKMKKKRVRILILTYVFIIVSFISHTLIAIRNYDR